MTITEEERNVLRKFGSIGGKKLLKQRGKKYFSEIGKKGGRPKKKVVNSQPFTK